jgi:hypothetical protein
MRPKRMSRIIVCSIFYAVISVAACIGVSSGADRQSKSLDQVLFKAVQDGNLERVRSALRQGANVNARDRDFAMTPIFYADTKVSRLLIEKGAQVNVKARKGMTPLVWAVYWDQKEKAALLIEKGADLNASDDDGKSALHVAANWGKTEFVRLLISKGADVNAQDSACWTPLHWAAFEGTAEVMELLMSAQADCSKVSCGSDESFPSGATPLDVAVRWRSPEVSAYLESRGCKGANVTGNPAHKRR